VISSDKTIQNEVGDGPAQEQASFPTTGSSEPHGFRCLTIAPGKIPLLLEGMKELDITEDTAKFAKLFEQPVEKLSIRLNELRVDYVLQFFSCLNQTGFITSSNRHDGFYQVLQYHVVNFDEVFLANRSIQRRVDLAKKLRSYPANKELFDRFFKSLIY